MLGNVSHGDCARWAQSGFIERRSAGIPAMFSVSIAESNELAMVVVDGGGSVEEGSFHVSQVRTGDVKNMTKPESLASDYVFLEPDSIDAMSRRMSVRYGERIKVLCDKNPELRSILNGGSTSGNAMAATALAFLSGFARAAVFNIRPTTGSLDTHTGHARIHASALKNCFEQVLISLDFPKIAKSRWYQISF
ncbi:MAG: hypothetical protein IPK68_13505 [Bdellovibrionales bacterium]|nr:hypothetical protein [Bdellovibrionales bacterium]